MLVLNLHSSLIPGICCDVIENSTFFWQHTVYYIGQHFEKNTPAKTLKQLCVLHHVSNTPSNWNGGKTGSRVVA
jgi:hypothetical protein